MRDRAKNIAYCREYRKTHPDKRYGTPEYNAIQAQRMRERRKDPVWYQNELSRYARRKRQAVIDEMRKELAVVA